MKAETLNIGELISRPVPFLVPTYQRTYAWEAEEVNDFVDDLLNVFAARHSGSGQSKEHFFGGLVSISHIAPSTWSGHSYEVVDGQQRLATSMITVGLIVDGLRSVAEQAEIEGDTEAQQGALFNAEEIEGRLLRYTEVHGSQRHSRLRLTLSKADKDFFEQLVNGRAPSPIRESHSRMVRAQQVIRQKLIEPITVIDSSKAKDKLTLLIELVRSLTVNCYVIHIVSDNKREAYQLFSTLNARGASLSDGDLLRSSTLEVLEGHLVEQEKVENYWDEVLSGTQTEIDRFLRTYFPSLTGQRAPKRDLHDSYIEKIFGGPALPMDKVQARGLEVSVANMREELTPFTAIARGQWPYENSSVGMWDRDRLGRLIGVLKHELCIPLLLSACRCLDEQRFSHITHLLERFAFRYITISRAHPAALYERYYAHATLIRDNPAAYDVTSLHSDLSRLASSNAPDNQFIAGLESLKYTQSSQQKRVVRHMLATLDDYYTWFNNGANGSLKPDRTRALDIDQVSIEHIYPQAPSVPDPTLENIKHHLGNLALWAPGENSGAGNEDFSSKRHKYSQSSMRLTRELNVLPQWDVRAMKARQERLIKMALHIFSI